jgi:MatE
MIELTESLIEGSSRPPALNDATKGEDIVRDLYVFRDDISKVKISVQTGIYLRLLVETLKMTPYVTAQVLITTSAFVCLSWTGDLLEHASFGLYNFLTLMFFISMTFSSMDKIGIEMSNAFGANNYKRCSEVLFMGIMTLFIEAAIVTFPTFFWSEELLVAIGIDPVIAKTVKMPLRWSLISVVLQMCVEVIQTFCMAQGLEPRTLFWQNRCSLASFGHASQLHHDLRIRYGYHGICDQSHISRSNQASALFVCSQADSS